MKLSFDWKFVIGSLIALAGLAIPLYLWQVDLSAHSLTIRLVSSSALQPNSSAQFRDLQITLNGTAIQSPYLSSFELENTGSKPLLSADFEGPIQLSSQGPVRFISAQLAGTDPKDIPVTITNNDDGVKISPFLSNSKDTVTFSVITSGEPPHFSFKSRIAGVKEIRYEDSSTRKGNLTVLTLGTIFAAISMLFYVGYLFEAALQRSAIVTRPVLILTGIICGVAGLFLVKKASDELDFFTPYASEIRIAVALLFILSTTFGGGYISYRRALKIYSQPK